MIVARLSCAMVEVVLSVGFHVQLHCRLVTFSGVEFRTGVVMSKCLLPRKMEYGRLGRGLSSLWVAQNG